MNKKILNLAIVENLRQSGLELSPKCVAIVDTKKSMSRNGRPADLNYWKLGGNTVCWKSQCMPSP